MEQVSLMDYANSAYNPGSPNPNPARNSAAGGGTGCIPKFRQRVGSVPKDLLSVKSVPKADLSKRKSESSPEKDNDNPKKVALDISKVDATVLSEVGDSLMERWFPKFQSMVSEAIAPLSTKLDTLQKNVDDVKADYIDLRKKVEILEQSIPPPPPSVESIVEQCLPDVRKIVSENMDTNWKIFLTEEIKKTESCLIVKGMTYPSNQSLKDAFLSFCSDSLKMSKSDIESLSIKQINSTKNTAKSFVLFVTLENVSQRNLCLKHSKNLAQRISLDKQVPKQYLKKYSEMQTTAWKLRSVHQVITRVDFNGPILTLRYKSRDSDLGQFSFTIHEEYTPKPEPPKQNPAFTPAPGLLPTTTVQSSCVGIMSDLKCAEGDNALDIAGLVLSTEDRTMVVKTTKSKKNIIFHFTTPESCLRLTEKYNNTAQNGQKIKFIKF